MTMKSFAENMIIRPVVIDFVKVFGSVAQAEPGRHSSLSAWGIIISARYFERLSEAILIASNLSK